MKPAGAWRGLPQDSSHQAPIPSTGTARMIPVRV